MLSRKLILFLVTLALLSLLLAPAVFADGPDMYDVDLSGAERTYSMTEKGPQVIVTKEVALNQQSALQALADTPLYVSIDGNDSGNTCGNPVAPCKTIGHALNVAIPLTTTHEIRVGIGTYYERGYVVYGGARVVSGGWITGANWTQVSYLNAISRTIVDGDSGGKLFSFRAGTVADNLTLREGSGNGNTALMLSGGAIGRRLIIENNSASSIGVVELYGPNNRLETSIIRNNTVGSFIPAVIATSGGCKPCFISNVTLYNNTGDGILQFAGGPAGSEELTVTNLLVKNQQHALWIASASSAYPTVNGIFLDNAALYNPDGAQPASSNVFMGSQTFGPLGELLFGPAVQNGIVNGIGADILNRAWKVTQHPDIGAVGYYGTFVRTYLPLITK